MRILIRLIVPVLAAVVVAARTPAASAAATKTEVVATADGHWQLLRDGQPYLIKGAGGSGPLDLLKRMGGNSVRTWGADDLGPRLEEAQRLGLSVTVGIWLGQERTGHFNYNNADDVAAQLARARATILKYKDHPAVLMWGIGNEMEGYGKGDNAAIWSAVDNIAAMAHRLDPDHPTMTVVAEIGGDRVRNLHRLCPDVDVVGVNSYAGAASLPRRYRAAGGTKPYVVTEFGPIGTWEATKTVFGAVVEPTSTAKADTYRQSYKSSVLGAPGLCLGSYAFTWGAKQEATSTWFGMLLPDGTRLGSAVALSELWTSRPPTVPAPTVSDVHLSGPDVVQPGDTVRASVEVADAAGRPLTVEWQLHREPAAHGSGGDAEAADVLIPTAIAEQGHPAVEVHLPDVPGIYRLYAVVRDDAGIGATADVPLKVGAATRPTTAPATATLPLVVYGNGTMGTDYTPSGWIGNTAAITLDPKCGDGPRTAGSTCLKCGYSAADGFGGVVWQDPANNWGDQPGGHGLAGAKTLSFWARGDAGGEKVTFKIGLLGPDKTFADTATGEQAVTLTKDWTRYTIDLSGKDLSRVMTAFCWVVAGQGKAVTFYLDDVRYE